MSKVTNKDLSESIEKIENKLTVDVEIIEIHQNVSEIRKSLENYQEF
tara:strand:+ start:772 stop:912 length:141 start_codon:yes stop_codon:yes gene_type:complete